MRKSLGLLIILVILFIFPGLVFASSAPAQSSSSYTTPANPAASDGSSTETVSIHLHDGDQNHVAGHLITLSSSNNTTAKFPKNDQITDGNGDATFTITSTTPGNTKITLFDSTNNVTFTDWFGVSFYDVSKGCVSNPPAPVLNSAISNSNNKVTLTWTDSPNPVSNYLVSYGTVSKSYIYGDTNIGAQGTTTFTIGSLDASKKYYFAVAANNNCGRSGFSNEMSVVVNPIQSISKPIATPTSIPLATTVATATPDITYISSDASFAPQPTEKSAATVSSEDVRTRIRNIGLGIIGVGILFIGVAIFVQKNKKDNSIPLIDSNVIQQEQNPPIVNNTPQQPFTF